MTRQLRGLLVLWWSACVAGQLDTHLDRHALVEYALDVYAPASSSVESELCRRHSLWFKDGVRRNKLWALKMLDASSKIPFGILAGNGADFGDYDQCLSVEDVSSEFGQFSGQHCMVSLGRRTYLNEINMLRRKALLTMGKLPTDNNVTLEGWESRLSLLWSVCVPSTCEPRDIVNHLRSALRPLLGNTSIVLQENACNSSAFKITLRVIDWLVICFLMTIIILTIVSTRYDITSWKSDTRNELYLALSLKLHRRKILKIYPPTVDDLPVLCGVRVISMLWILLVHHEMITFIYPALNHHIINQTATCAVCKFVSNSMAVDTFLLVSGLLACFNFFKNREKGIPFSLPRYYLHRYIRLTPTFFMMQLLSVTLFTIPGWYGGPMWRHNAANLRGLCDNWFHNMLFITNYQPMEEMCLGHVWYLAVEMQILLLSPLLLYPLWRWPGFGKFLLGAMAILGAVISILVAYDINFQPQISLVDQGSLGDLHYYPTHTRFTPWLVGIAVGYLLHRTKHATPRVSRRLLRAAWFLSVLLMTGSLPVIHLMLSPGHQPHRLLDALYLGLMRPAWALGVAWLVFALSRGYGPRSMTSFLSLPIFQVLSRISYSIYLTHIGVLFFQLAHMRTPSYLHITTLGPGLLANIILSIAVGVVFHVSFEAPPIYVEQIIMQRKWRLKTE